MQDELLLGGEQRKTASTGSINSPTAASGWSRGTWHAAGAARAPGAEVRVAQCILTVSLFWWGLQTAAR